MIGQYNNINTVAQGYEAIAAAYKPTLTVQLTSQNSDSPMIFGGVFDVTKNQDFWEDNVGITSLILKQSTKTNFTFFVNFESEAILGDGD